MFAMLASVLSGCATRQGLTVPTAIIYDRDRDSWRVEVEDIGDAMPGYPETVPIFTEEDGDRRQGLIPPARYRVANANGAIPQWEGPMSLKRRDTFWRDSEWFVQTFKMWLPATTNPNEPAEVSVEFDNEVSKYYIRYQISVKGRGLAR